MILDRIATGAAALPQFKAAFEFLSTLNENTPIGRIDISDRIYCNVMEYDANEPWAPGRLEAHKKYSDIQAVLAGNECMVYQNIAGLAVQTPYDDAKDVMFYQAAGAGASRIELIPGLFAVFFPNDGHMGRVAPFAGACKIKKAVVKVLI